MKTKAVKVATRSNGKRRGARKALIVDVALTLWVGGAAAAAILATIASMLKAFLTADDSVWICRVILLLWLAAAVVFVGVFGALFCADRIAEALRTYREAVRSE